MSSIPLDYMKLFLIALIFVGGCSPRVVRNGYEYSGKSDNADCNVTFKKLADFEDDDVEIIGTVKIRDNGFSTNCEESDILKILKQEACAVGADIVHIIEEKRADRWSTCYRVDAELLKSKDSQYAANLETDGEYKADQVSDRVSSDKNRKTIMVLVPIISSLMAILVLTLTGAL